jgi:Fe-S-cluster-containing dehydrogenase component/DMSO reductase anchor subunit
MRNGFIFDHNKCVSCNACCAACILENGWKVHPRNIFTYNSTAEHFLPVINLSLACNHCESGACMKGCPASAYRREPDTGAIIIDEKLCIGCRYCQWICPYDAPKFDIISGTIAKCNLCYTGLKDGLQPACSSACPTGALSFGQLSDQNSDIIYSWFPDKKLYPSIEFTGTVKESSLKIIPENIFKQKEKEPLIETKDISDDISLIIFSFLATLSVATIIISFLRGVYPGKMVFIPALVLTGVVSLFHLGRKLRSWRSVMNVRNSPISREILLLIIYGLISSVTVLSHIPVLLIISSITGIIFLVVIDSVYVYAERSKSVRAHSGQTFISALLIVSYFAGDVLPFIFIGSLKIAYSLYSFASKKQGKTTFEIRFLRLAFLIISGVSMISHISYSDIFVSIMFLAGELLDRIIFYIDFNPINIKTMILDQINIDKDEKERG